MDQKSKGASTAYRPKQSPYTWGSDEVSECSHWGSAKNDVWNAPGLEIKAIASYKGPELPPDEEERMRTVCCAVQDDKDDAVLSSICKLVCSLLKVPSAAVSIVETTRQYLKSTYGSQRSILPRSMSFCQFTFLTRLPVVLVIEDALQDERFAENPLVTHPTHPLRFYAGAPLIASNGKRLGALCLMDTKPRKMTVEDYRVLNSCAEMVVRRLEAYTHIELTKLETKTMIRTLNAFKQAIFLCDVASRGWPVLHANDALLGQLGVRSEAEITKRSVWELFKAAPESEEQVREGFLDHTSQLQRFSVWLQLKDRADSPSLHVLFKPATEDSLDCYTPQIEVPGGIPRMSSAAEDLPYYFAIIQSTKPAEGAPQAQSASSSEDWRQDFKPLDEGLQTKPKLQTIPDLPEGKCASANHTDTGKDADVAAISAQGGGNAPNKVSRGPEGGADGAKTGTPELLPAKSGKLESKERISSMLQGKAPVQIKEVCLHREEAAAWRAPLERIQSGSAKHPQQQNHP